MKKYKFTIKSEITIFITILSVVLIGVVWLLNIFLLEPIYNKSIENKLIKKTNEILFLIDQGEGVNSATVQNEIYELVSVGECLEISHKDNLQAVFTVEGLGTSCALHPKAAGFFASSSHTEINSSIAFDARKRVVSKYESEPYIFTLNNKSSAKQLLCGVVSQSGYVVILSQNLEKISEAVDVLKSQMIFVSLAVIFIGVTFSLIFSYFFTKPLTSISSAARRLADGDYKARAKDSKRKDELGELVSDFNLMAQQVSQSDKLQKDLMANISHDLRTPLTLIRGYAETTRDINGENQDKRTQQMNIIVDESERLSGLVNSVMELSKLSSGTEKPKMIKFDIDELCDEVCYKYSAACEQQNYKLQYESIGYCEVLADPDLITRVLHNYIGNGVNHIGEDGIVKVKVSKIDASVRISVTDNGDGIAKEDLPFVFDRYFRSRKDQGKVGTGLGLSIVKAILISHECDFGVESKLGEGATFWFELDSI